MIVTIIFYGVLLLYSLFYIWLMRQKMRWSGLPPEMIHKKTIVFMVGYWLVILLISLLAYTYHKEIIPLVAILFLGGIIIIIALLGIRRVKRWMEVKQDRAGE